MIMAIDDDSDRSLSTLLTLQFGGAAMGGRGMASPLPIAMPRPLIINPLDTLSIEIALSDGKKLRCQYAMTSAEWIAPPVLLRQSLLFAGRQLCDRRLRQFRDDADLCSDQIRDIVLDRKSHDDRRFV